MRHLVSTLQLLSFVFLSSVAVVARSDEEAASAGDAEPSVAKLAGVFEAVKSDELTAGTEHIKSLEIKKIVPHGKRVMKDENVAWFETEDVDEQIQKARSQLRLSELAFADEEFAHEQFLESQQLDKAAAQRTYQKAKTDYDNFVQVDRERRMETARFNLKNSQASLENAMEELTQLEQMYEEDDLTEESEEIVLKRARRAVENAQFRLEGTEISTERALQQTIPRSKAEQEDALTRAQLAYEKALRDIKSARQRREIELEQKREKFKQEQEDFAELQEERKQLVLQAPHDGIVFHGQLNRGKVSDKPSTLEKGSTVTGEQVLVTLAVPDKLQIRVDLSEKDLSHVQVGMQGKVKVTAYPDRQITATIKSISDVPYAGSKFDCVLSLKMPPGEPAVMPGMTCEIEFKLDREESEE